MDLGLCLQRAGQPVATVEMPDRFTVSLTRGVAKEKALADHYHAMKGSLPRQDLEALRSTGQPLDPATGACFEPRDGVP